MNVCLATTHLFWNTTLGGHAWVFVNQALGLQDAGCRVTLLEELRRDVEPQEFRQRMTTLHDHLLALGLDARLCIATDADKASKLRDAFDDLGFLVTLDDASSTANCSSTAATRCPQTSSGALRARRYSTLTRACCRCGSPRARSRRPRTTSTSRSAKRLASRARGFPTATSPGTIRRRRCTCRPGPLQPIADCSAPFVTVTNWWGKYEWVAGQTFNNEKRTHFIAMLDLPMRTKAALELAIYHEQGNASEMPLLREHGWRARPAFEVSGSPEQYRSYLQQSRGEFSCAKPSCMRFANAWVSDRTLCFLASGRPAVVQHTGASSLLPDREGLLRFANIDEAQECLELVLRDPELHARRARELAEAHFDSEKVATHLLERALSPSLRMESPS